MKKPTARIRFMNMKMVKAILIALAVLWAEDSELGNQGPTNLASWCLTVCRSLANWKIVQ